MSFLWPGILGLTAALLIPILIHIFGERRYEKVYFSSIRLLKQIETDSLRQVKLRQIIILILRSLGILFLVLALAGPFAGGWRLGKPGEGILLVDTSPSARFHNDYEKIRNHLTESFPDWPLLEISGDSSPEDMIREFLHNRSREPEHVVLLTDLQANEGVSALLETVTNSFSKAQTPVIFRLPAIREEAYITRLDIPSRYYPAGEFVPVRATLSAPDSRNPLAYLTVNGKRIAQTRPDEDQVAEFSFLAESPGRYDGVVRAEGSDHPFNQRYFTLTAGQQIRVLATGNPNSYLYPALEAIQSVDFRYTEPEAFPGTVPEREWDLLIINGLHELSSSRQARIRQFGESHPLWIIMDRRPSGNWQDFLKLSSAEEIKHGPGEFSITEKPPDPPFSDFPSFSVSRYFRIQAEDGTSLIRFTGNDPYLFQADYSNLYIQTAPFTLADNRMGIHPRFTRMIKDLIFYVTGRGTDELQVGDKIPIRQAGDEIIRPDGRRVKVLEDYTETDIPGIYILKSNGEETYFAINWPETETIDDFTEGPVPGFRVLTAQEDEISDVRASLKGRSLTPLLFLLTALCWGGELLLMTLNMKKSKKDTK